MARNADLKAQRELIDRLLAKQAPLIREAFLEAIRDARDAVRLQDVVAALVRGDVEGAARLLQIDRTFLAPLDQAMAGAYYEAGRAENAELMRQIKAGGLTLEVRFDPGAPRAAAWVRQHSSQLITEIVEDQRVAVRQALGAGLDAGRNPRTVALDIVGRIDKATGRRAGGIVGLTSGQAKIVENARAELASGDPGKMQAYLERRLRDRRFDTIVRAAMREEQPVAAVDVQRIVTRYSDRMLAYRGEIIGRTESLTALSYAQNEAMTQMLDAGGIRREQVDKIWGARLDGRTRDSHAALSGTKIPLMDTFVSPATGARMRFPRDTSLGAGGEDTISCRCYATFSMDLSKG